MHNSLHSHQEQGQEQLQPSLEGSPKLRLKLGAMRSLSGVPLLWGHCRCVFFLGIFARPRCRSMAGGGWEGHSEFQPWIGTSGQRRGRCWYWDWNCNGMGIALGQGLQWDGNPHGAGIPVGLEFLYLIVSWSWLSCLKRRCRCSICSEVTARERREVTGAGTSGHPSVPAPHPSSGAGSWAQLCHPHFPAGPAVSLCWLQGRCQGLVYPLFLLQEIPWPSMAWNGPGQDPWFQATGTGLAALLGLLAPWAEQCPGSSSPLPQEEPGVPPCPQPWLLQGITQGSEILAAATFPLPEKRKGHGGGTAAPQNQCLALKLLPLLRVNPKPLGWLEWGPPRCWGSA